MLTERNRHVPREALIYPLGEGEINGASDVERALADTKRVEAAQRLNAVAEQATELVLAATMQARAAKMIEWAIAQLKPGAGAEQLNFLSNHIQGFARDAAEFLERGDLGGLNHAITGFHNVVVMDLPKMEPPKPPLMPPGENIFYYAGWSREEELGLRNILAKGGDRCTALDRDGATLASGKSVSRAQALEAYIPPAGGKTFAVGSLPAVLGAIRAAQS